MLEEDIMKERSVEGGRRPWGVGYVNVEAGQMSSSFSLLSFSPFSCSLPLPLLLFFSKLALYYACFNQPLLSFPTLILPPPPPGTAPKPAAPVDPWGAPPSVPPMKSSDPWASNSTPASDPWSSAAARPKTSNAGDHQGK